jgi:hypothetical protein
MAMGLRAFTPPAMAMPAQTVKKRNGDVTSCQSRLTMAPAARGNPVSSFSPPFISVKNKNRFHSVCHCLLSLSPKIYIEREEDYEP